MCEVAERNEFVISRQAVILLGSGSNFQAVHRATKDNVIHRQVDVLVPITLMSSSVNVAGLIRNY